MDLSGRVLNETYRLERLLGEGGMGEVYVASHLRLERKFAVKLLIADAAKDQVSLDRFHREARVTSALGHPHIIEVTDTNVAEGRPYLVMELLEGEDLGVRLDRVGPMSLAEIASIIRQVTSALHAAHERGVVHRDLKPENVFLCLRGNRDDYVKLLDFGISKVLGSGTVQTRQRTLVGSPCYMSPEQADERTSEVDLRTDIYAVGTMCFEMLAGNPPFEAASLPSLLYKIVHQQPPDILTLRQDIPEALAEVLRGAMHKDREQRFQSIEEFWATFSEVLETTASVTPEKTKISHTAWPEHPETPEVTTGETPMVAVGRPPQAHQLGRSTTLSASAGEITGHRRGRAKMVLLAAGGTLLLTVFVFIVAVWALSDDPPEKGTIVVGSPGQVETGVAPARSMDAESRPQPDLERPVPVQAPDAQAPDTSAAGAPDAARRIHPVSRKASFWVGTGGDEPAKVYLDGKRVGTTPLKIETTAGRHRVELRQHGRWARTRVTLQPGKNKRVVLVPR